MSDATCVRLGTASGDAGASAESADARRLAIAAGVKWVVEWPLALVLLVVSVPMMLVLAVVLKMTSEGPITYSQVRLGLNGRTFRILKFRTMTHGCEALTGPVWSIAGDPRVTKVGRWLRDTHLDELPQLWNVLRGEMSLIGPRPERPEIAAQIERWLPQFRERLRVRPGIAGLAQVCLPPDADLHTVRRKLTYDLRYIRSMGVVLDARIAVATVLHMVSQGLNAVARSLVRTRGEVPTIEHKEPAPTLGFALADHGISSKDADVRGTDLSKVA